MPKQTPQNNFNATGGDSGYGFFAYIGAIAFVIIANSGIIDGLL